MTDYWESEDGQIKLHCCDCMELMARYPDKHFDLAIVDPPYGIGISGNPVRQQHERKDWDDSIPGTEYFLALFKAAKEQIVWGGNYFGLPASQGFVIWDKGQPEDFSLAMCEYAWSSIQSPAKLFRYSVLKEKNKQHPTQKPVNLYGWLLNKYAQKGQHILDTHLGSGSIAIACRQFGCSLVASELDPDYFDAAVERIKREYQQPVFVL